MAAKAMRNLHVPLPEPLHDRLRAEAERSGRAATTLAREAIETWIEEHQRRALHDAIVEYAGEMAGSPADLDEQLERASVAHLVRSRRKR
jgi:predicted DNA-binding protein